GHQVVQAVEVAVGGGLSLPGGVAAVVVERDVVEPVRTQRDVLIRHGSVGEGRAGVHVGEFAGACVFGRVERVPVSVQVRRIGFADIVVLALGVIDHIGGVVGDDVEIDVDAACVGLVDELLEFSVGAQVGVDLGEVGDPVAVVAGRGVLALALHRTVREGGGEPDGGGAQALDVVEAVDEPGDVAAVVEGLAGGVEAGSEPSALEPAGVVAGVPVGEPVGHHEVELFLLAVPAGGCTHQSGIVFGVVPVQAGHVHSGAVGGGVEGEGQCGRPGQIQLVVLLAAVHPIGGLPVAAGDDLELVLAGGDLELAGVGALPRGGQGGLRAGGGPILLAAQFGLERAGQDDARRGGGGRWGKGDVGRGKARTGQ